MKKIILIAVVLVLCIALFTCGGEPSSDDGTSEETTTQAAATQEATESEQDVSFEADPEYEKATAKVDELYYQAKEDAKDLTEEEALEAAAIIANTYPDFYTDDETMETIIYNGYLLEHWEDGPIEYRKFGQDAVQAVKYVYRGVESVEDEATQLNLEQIEKDSIEIVYGE